MVVVAVVMMLNAVKVTVDVAVGVVLVVNVCLRSVQTLVFRVGTSQQRVPRLCPRPPPRKRDEHVGNTRALSSRLREEC